MAEMNDKDLKQAASDAAANTEAEVKQAETAAAKSAATGVSEADGKIKFEGKESKNPMAFHYYDAEKVIMGKKMKDCCFSRSWAGENSRYGSKTANP